MSRNRKIGKSFFQIIIALIIFFLLFFVDLDYLEDKCTFLRIFIKNYICLFDYLFISS